MTFTIAYWDGEELRTRLSTPAEDAQRAADLQERVVPSQVTSRQGGLALLAHGHYQTLMDAVEALPEPQRTAAKIEIGAPFWERSSQAVATFGPLLGLTDAQIDALFIEAAAL